MAIQHYQQNGYANGVHSSGVMSDATPNFSPNNLHHNHTRNSAIQEDQKSGSNHWVEQISLYRESQQMALSKEVNPHSKKPGGVAMLKEPQDDTDTDSDDVFDDSGRRSNRPKVVETQHWKGIDLSGHGIPKVVPQIFAYEFLNELYLSHNELTKLPAQIGALRNLRTLDVSNNKLTELPVEVGMCVFLEKLLLFDNKVRKLPHQLGALCFLEMLGIEGNPIEQSYKQCIVEKGTKELIELIRENAPGTSLRFISYSTILI